MHTFTVIGGGNGGTAITAYLLSRGANVRLFDLYPSYIEDIASQGSINLTHDNKTLVVKPTLVTTKPEEAIKGAKLIMVVTPAFTHKQIAEAISEHLSDGQIIVLNPGRTAGAIDFKNTLIKTGCTKDVVVAETQSLIYSCRKTDGNSVTIYGVKNKVDISSLPANRIDEVIAALSPYYPQFKAVPNVLWTGFLNIGSMFHPTPVILNTGRIEADTSGFKYYWEGISPSVAALVEKLDLERIEVAQAYEVETQTAVQWLKTAYGTVGDSLYENIQSNSAYEDILAPKSIDVRYLSEDIPTGLVPISEFGSMANIKTPNIDAIIQIASTLLGTDFLETGRTLHNLGIKNLTKKQVLEYFKTGKMGG